MDIGFWKGKRVFISGHTGFKGSWLCKILYDAGAEISGLSLPLNDSNLLYKQLNLDIKKSYFEDVNNLEQVKFAIQEAQPEILFHLAAQPLVSESYDDPIYTFQTNIIGTAKLLLAAASVPSIVSLVNITSDKCYENNNELKVFKESDPMGGFDPYSASKGCAEIVSTAIKHSFFDQTNIRMANVRAGNVIGGGDMSKDRLLPDIIRAINNNEVLPIRSLESIRPWQHVIEPLFGYLEIAQGLYENRERFVGAWNFGPELIDCISVKEVINIVSKRYKDFKYSIGDKIFSESKLLRLDNSKAKTQLDWKPRWSASNSIAKTLDFNERYMKGESMNRILSDQIDEYQELING